MASTVPQIVVALVNKVLSEAPAWPCVSRRNHPQYPVMIIDNKWVYDSCETPYEFQNSVMPSLLMHICTTIKVKTIGGSRGGA